MGSFPLQPARSGLSAIYSWFIENEILLNCSVIEKYVAAMISQNNFRTITEEGSDANGTNSSDLHDGDLGVSSFRAMAREGRDVRVRGYDSTEQKRLNQKQFIQFWKSLYDVFQGQPNEQELYCAIGSESHFVSCFDRVAKSGDTRGCGLEPLHS